MRFGVLGPLAVWTDEGAPVAVPGRKVRALLADLLVHEGRPVPADRLIDDIWGERPPPSAPATLSAKVSQLRRVLEDAEPGGHALVVSGPAGYALRAAPDAVDARRFAALAAQARSAEPRAAAALLTEALGLWRGPALTDFADVPFATAVIALLAEQRLTAQEDAAELRLGLGEHAAVAVELGPVVAEHPLRERLRGCAIRALHGAGRQREALESYQELRTRLADELGLDPSPELVALHQAVLTRGPALDPPAPRAGNLPAPRTALVRRDAAVADVAAHLATDRLVTLTGPGGVGKTRLAFAAAAAAALGFSDGAWLVELAPVAPVGGPADPDPLGSLVDAVLAALDVRASTGPGERTTPLHRLTEALRGRQLLLVLDNCEHVVEHVAELADRLLSAAPGLRMLAMSREPLALAGEVVWSVPPLSVPAQDAADPEALAGSSAVQLFVARAAAAAKGFRLDAGTAALVTVLCRRLDGIPLALELAATRVRALGVDGVAARLDDRFRLLAAGHRGAPPRQQTLRAMIDWSWELLTPPEQVLLRRLAVHADGATVDAAAAVAADVGLPAADVPDLLARLVDRSLVDVVPGAGPRYRLLESVAEYSLGRLGEAGEVTALRCRHADHYLALAEEAAADLRGPQQPQRLRELDAEAANLRVALATAVAAPDPDGALRLVAALAWYWVLRGRGAVHPGAAGARAERPGRPAARRRAGCSPLRRDRGHVGAGPGERLARRARGVRRRPRPRHGTAPGGPAVGRGAGPVAGGVHPAVVARLDRVAGRGPRRATAHGERALALATEQGVLGAQVFARIVLGYAARRAGRLDVAERHLALVLEVTPREAERGPHVSMVLSELGFIAELRGDPHTAAGLHGEAYDVARKIAASRDCALVLAGLAGALAVAGAHPAAATLLGAAEATRAATGLPMSGTERADVERATAATRAALGEPGFAAAYAAGEQLTPDEARARADAALPSLAGEPRHTPSRHFTSPRHRPYELDHDHAESIPKRSSCAQS